MGKVGSKKSPFKMMLIIKQLNWNREAKSFQQHTRRLRSNLRMTQEVTGMYILKARKRRRYHCLRNGNPGNVDPTKKTLDARWFAMANLHGKALMKLIFRV